MLDENYDIEAMDDAEIARYAQRCRAEWLEYSADVIEEAKNMRLFIYKDGGQWDGGVAADREIRGKVTLENNMMRRLIRQMVAEYRQNDPQSLVVPVDTKEPSIKMEDITGILRNIAYESRSKIVYGHAYQDMLVCAFGAIELVTIKEHRTSYNNVLRMDKVVDVLTCGWDPEAEDFCKTDGDFAYRDFEMSARKVKETFDLTDEQIAELSSVTNDENNLGTAKKGNLLLTKLYAKNYKSNTTYVLEDGVKVTEEEYERMGEEAKENNKKMMESYEQEKERIERLGIDPKFLKKPELQPEEIPYERSEKEMDWDVWMLICARNTCLKRVKLPVKFLPLYFGAAEVAVLDGKEVPQSYAIDAKTPQKLLNYFISEIADGVNRNPGVRILANDQTVLNYIDDWLRPKANLTLRWNKDPLDPNTPPPQIINPSAIDPSMLQGYQQASQDVLNVMGKNNNAEQNAPTSGVDFLYRQLSMNTVSGVFPDSLNMMIAEVNKGILEWLPHVFDTERTIKSRDNYGKVKNIKVNQASGQRGEDGKLMPENSLKELGSFSVEVYGGPSFAAQRFAGLQFLADIMKSNVDKLQPIMLDLAIKESPFDFSQELVQRLIESGFINPKVLPEDQRPPQEPQQPPMEEKMFKLEVMKEIVSIVMRSKEMKQKDKELTLKAVQSLMDFETSKKKAEAEDRKAEAEEKSAEAEEVRAEMETITAMTTSEAQNLATLANIAKTYSDIDGAEVKNIIALLQDVIGKQQEVSEQALEEI